MEEAGAGEAVEGAEVTVNELRHVDCQEASNLFFCLQGPILILIHAEEVDKQECRLTSKNVGCS